MIVAGIVVAVFLRALNGQVYFLVVLNRIPANQSFLAIVISPCLTFVEKFIAAQASPAELANHTTIDITVLQLETPP